MSSSQTYYNCSSIYRSKSIRLHCLHLLLHVCTWDAVLLKLLIVCTFKIIAKRILKEHSYAFFNIPRILNSCSVKPSFAHYTIIWSNMFVLELSWETENKSLRDCNYLFISSLPHVKTWMFICVHVCLEHWHFIFTPKAKIERTFFFNRCAVQHRGQVCVELI